MGTGAWDVELPVTAQATRAYRTRSLLNLSRMGHCAPTVAQTLLDLAHRADGEWLVKLAAGLPGGVGNTRCECGGVTAVLLHLGLRHGDARTERGLPLVVEKGHAYCRGFLACHGSLACSEILGERRLPLPCVKVVRAAPELLAGIVRADTSGAISPAAAAAYAHLSAHLAGRGFHCAHAVLRRLGHLFPVTAELLAATRPFVGGTLFLGKSCSALAAGVMAMGLRAGEIETRRRRVVRMLVTMAAGGDALADGLNRFNPSMNRGRTLARWFAGELGSTQCRAITGRDFASAGDVARYVEDRQVERCEDIASMVAGMTEALLERGRAH